MARKKTTPSKWQRQADRNRKVVTFTLSDEARETLDTMALRSGETKSALVERLIFDAAKKRAERHDAPSLATDANGNVLPTDAIFERIERAYPDLERGEKFRFAQVAMITELITNSVDAFQRKTAKKKPKEKK